MSGIPKSRHYAHVDGELLCDGVSLTEIAEEFGTPTYVYSGASIDRAYAAIDEALSFAPHLIAYAVKANSNLAVLARLRDLGAGADIVSGGELARCLEVGIGGDRIVFSGVGKRDEEIEAALRASIRSIHVESAQEIEAIEAIAERLGVEAPISLRINPDVDPKTHPYIATGLHHTKFGLEIGVAEELLPRILRSKRLVLEGVTCHIGSQIGDVSSLREAVGVTASLAKRCRDAGAPIRTLDAGGGWPIPYGDESDEFPEAQTFGDAIRDGLADGRADDMGLEIIVEPGRALVGESGTLLSRVIFVKDQPYRPDAVAGASHESQESGDKRFVIVDASMSELIRPALYDAHHGISPVETPPPQAARSLADVVGPVCESGDWLAKDRLLPPLERGDLIAIMSAGAYGMVMASNYNSRPRPAEVLIDNGEYRAIRERETFAELMRSEERG